MLNKIFINGRLTTDPELKSTPTGKSVVNTTVACKRNGKDAKTDFIPISVWGTSAEYLKNYAKKGTLVSVCGELQTSSYKKGDVTIPTFSIYAEEVYIIGNKKETNDIEKEEEVEEIALSSDGNLPY